MRSIATILLCGLLAFGVKAQGIKQYPTRDGMLGISIYYQGKLLNVGSNELRVVLDYETTEILIKLRPATLRTKVDSLDAKLQYGILKDILFKGKLGIDYINTEGYPLQDFEVEGDLTINGITNHVTLQGTLQHRKEGPNIQAILYLHYDVPLADFGLKEQLVGFADYGCVEIQQAVMAPPNKN